MVDDPPSHPRRLARRRPDLRRGARHRSCHVRGRRAFLVGVGRRPPPGAETRRRGGRKGRRVARGHARVVARLLPRRRRALGVRRRACTRPGRRQGTARATRRGGSGPRDLDDPDVDHGRERAEPRSARVGRLPCRRASGADRAARRRVARHRAPRAPAAVGRLSVSDTGRCQDGRAGRVRSGRTLRALGAPFGVATRIAPCGRTGAESTEFGLDRKRCLTPISSRRVPSPLRGALGVWPVSPSSAGRRRRRCARRTRTSWRRRSRPAPAARRSGRSRGRTPGPGPPG